MNNLANRIKQSRLYPALRFEDLISHRLRHGLILASWALTLSLSGLLVRAHLLGQIASWRPLLGASILGAIIGVSIYLLEAFFRSFYFASIITNDYRPNDLFTFTVGRILYRARGGDVLPAFMRSETGGRVLRRLGLTPTELTSFLQSRSSSSSAGVALELAGTRPLTLRQLADWLYANDAAFVKFLFRHQINTADLDGAVAWVTTEIETAARHERWWSRERLERVAGIAKTWAFGATPTLDRYAENLLEAEQAGSFAQAVSFRRTEVRQLENVLLRSREANAILVGPAGEGKMDIVWEFANEIKSGAVAPALEHRRPVLLRTALLLADHRDRNTFEQTMLKLLVEATRSGNVILIIDNLPALMAGAERLGSELAALLNPYLASAELTIVALADTDAFHRLLEINGELMQRFEPIKIGESNRDRLLNFLEQTAGDFERRTGLFFTYQSLVELIASAERYFQNESVADQALDLLVELVPWAIGQRRTIIGREDVLEFVGEKTQIPMGAIGVSERQSLLKLEEHLRGQVVGQETALRAISQALRRNRAGLASRTRPIGTFLFLGPTGVGKTETAKALARVLFGREEALLRLDMSEYQSADALNRLIGSFADNKPGILATLLRDNPYGVLLLDEFEKTERGVLNLFLQILDEGFFSDAFGRRVNARNLLVIATSNAAAELIWQMIEQGRDPGTARTELVDYLIQKAIFRPELLNRFDEIVIFHPLGREELNQVARLMLTRVAAGLRDRGIELKLSEDLIRQVAAAGSDRVFGARPLRRFIQDQVEQVIADRIIKGELRAGETVELSNVASQPAA